MCTFAPTSPKKLEANDENTNLKFFKMPERSKFQDTQASHWGQENAAVSGESVCFLMPETH